MVHLISFNVSGLRNKKKRLIIFDWLKRKNCDVALLQEVYSNQDDILDWKNEWGGQIFSSHGTNRSKGVITLINPKSDIKSNQIFGDKEGRLLGVKIEVENEMINIWNIYAPNEVQNLG